MFVRVVCFIFLCVFAFPIFGQVAPSTPASNLSASETYCSTTRLSWTSGNGVARMIIASEGAPVSFNPVNNVYYIGDADFGDGFSFSPSEYVVYNGTGSFAIIENLKSNTVYYFSVIEYNGGGSVYSYGNISTPSISVTTENLSATISVNDSYQCLAENEFSHSSTVLNSNGGVLSYAWDFDDGNTSIEANPNHTFGMSGIYDVELIISSVGCEYAVEVQDTVAPQPIASFVLDPSRVGNVTPQSLRKLDNTLNRFWFDNLTVAPSLGGTISNTISIWDFGDGTSEEVRNTSKSYLAPGVYTVRLIVSNTQNDVDLCLDTFQMDVEVKPLPLDSSLLDIDTAQCFTGNVFEFSHATLDPTVSHTWSFGDGATAIGSTVTHTYASTGVFTVRLEATDLVGGYSLYEQQVVVAEDPNADFSGLSLRYCLGNQEVVLTPTLANGEWQGDYVTSSGIFSPTAVGITEVTHILEESGCIDTVTKSTEVFSLPLFEIGEDTTICTGSSFTKLVPADGATVAWSTGGADTTITISQAGIYWASKTLNGCTYRDTFEVEIIDAPAVNLGGDSTLCGDGIVRVDIGASEATYVWSDGYTDSGERLITETGVYTVTVTNKCGSASDEVDLTFLPYKCDILIPTAFSPNGDGLNPVFRPSGNVAITYLGIYSLWGEKLYESNEEFWWDGTYRDKDAQGGSYIYIIEYMQPEEGVTQRKIAKGELFLVR